MKVKRILCTLLALCTLTALFPSAAVFADEDYSHGKWQYCVILHTSSTKNAEANVGSKNNPTKAIKATLEFSDNGTEKSVSGLLTNSKNKDVDETFADGNGWVTIDCAPWSFTNLHLENLYTDYYRFYSAEVKARYIQNDSYPNYSSFGSKEFQLFKKYPGGENSKSSGGQEIVKGIDFDFDYRSNSFGKDRTVKSTKNFQKHLSQEIHLNERHDANNNTTQEIEWDGVIQDQYTQAVSQNAGYDATCESNAPKLEFSKVTGQTGTGGSISVGDLAYYSIKATENGYSYNTKTLFEKMGENRLGRFTCALDLKVDGKVVDTASVTFVRDTFDFSEIKFNNVSYTYTQGTDTINNYNSGASSAGVRFKLSWEAANAISNYDINSLTGKTFKYTKAYIESKDSENNTIKRYANGSEKGGSVTLNGRYFTLSFPYNSDDDTGENGLKLVIEGGEISSESKTYVLYDKKNKTTNFKEDCLTYRIDAKAPKLTFSRSDDVSSKSGYSKTAAVNIKSDEASFLQTAGKTNRADNSGYAMLELRDATDSSTYRIGHFMSQNSKSYTSQQIPLTGGGDGTDVTLSLEDAVEGEFTLVVYGADKANNSYRETYSGIKLDNKAPETKLVSASEGTKLDSQGNIKETVSNKYTVSLSDASGTGTIWYMFTEKDPNEAKKLGTSETTGEAGAGSSSGELQTLLGQWQSVKQTDLADGKNAELILTMTEGKSFNGSLIWYAIDDFGNKSDYNVINNIKITNESTSYEIRPSEILVCKPSYEIEVTSPNNAVSYRWKEPTMGKNSEKYLFEEYRPVKDGVIDTSKDPETASLDGEYILELKIQTPSGAATLYPQKSFVFDGAGPDASVSVAQSGGYAATANVTINIDDRAGVGSATGTIVAPSEIEAEGASKFEIPVKNGAVESYSPNLSGLPSGVYKLKITATDIHNQSKTTFSEPFYVRNGAPEGSVSVASQYTHDDCPIIADGEKLTLKFAITESFKNADSAPKQTLYYRVGTSDAPEGEWREAGTMTASGDAFVFNGSAQINLDFADGLNTLYVQTAVYPKDEKITRINTANIFETETEFYMDEKAPEEPKAIINDIHTTGTVNGWIEVSDNSFDFGGALSAECDKEFETSIEIGEYSGGAFPITVKKNVTNAKIYIYDEAHNKATAEFSVYGIDTEPPEIAYAADPSDVVVGDEQLGRKDIAAEITVKGMNGSAEFALIKEEDRKTAYQNGVISDDYFKTDHYAGVHFTVTEIRSEDAYFDGEENKTYSVSVAGADGEWVIGVRAKDAVGNSADVVLKSEFTTKNADISIEMFDEDGGVHDNWYVTPKEAEQVAVLKVHFNIPVYVLPQDKIVTTVDSATDDDTTEEDDTTDDTAAEEGDTTDDTATEKALKEANLDRAALYAQAYSQDVSLRIKQSDFASSGEDEENKTATYLLYAVDDLGRTECIEITVTENLDVTFNSASDVTYGIYYQYDLHSKLEKICAEGSQPTGYLLIVEPKKEGTLLLPDFPLEPDAPAYETEVWKKYYGEKYEAERECKTTNGFIFSESYSEAAYGDDGNKLGGFKKLAYEIWQVEADSDDGYYKASDVEDRILEVKAFTAGNGPSDEDNVSLKTLVVSDIDNTAPRVTYTQSPETLPTPGDVTFTVTAQDKESGIKEIVAFTYETADGGGEAVVVEPDENGYWSWDGSKDGNEVWKRVKVEKKDEAGEPYYDEEYQKVKLPLVITYYGAQDGGDPNDKFGVKTLMYTFTDEVDMTHESGMNVGMFENSLGAVAYAQFGISESGISTKGLIYKMPIEEGTDYEIVYTDKDGNTITDINGYYNNAKATIELLARGKTRGLYVSNNSRAYSKELNVYQPTFEFKLKDKFGYEASAAAELVYFDQTPGEISYTLSESGKTNKPITIVISAKDEESGVSTVTLGGTENITLSGTTESDGAVSYTGEISQNGTYNIVMYDKAGNKTVKTFTVSNVNKDVPTIASVTFSSAGQKDVTVLYKEAKDYDSGTSYYTSRPVVATLEFSKTNVRITSVKSNTLTEADYSVNYGTSEITFLKSGTIEVEFADDYGNTSSGNTISVGNIDATPPEIVADAVKANGNSVDVTFKLADSQKSVRGGTRKETDIWVAYGGMIKPIAYTDDNKNTQQSVFTFTENGNYTLKVYDKNEALSSYYTLSITEIDKTAPKITLLEWWYGDDEENKQSLSTEAGTLTEGAEGYRVATDKYDRTKDDVTVKIQTGDDETKLSGVDNKYSTSHTRIWGENGMFTFNAEKKNGQIMPYGVDIRVIDKTPPVIDLGEVSEIIYYENESMNDPDFDLAKALEAYEAYDVFDGVTTALTEKVKVSYFDSEGNAVGSAAEITGKGFNSSKPCTVTYTVSDSVGNETTAKRTVRLVGKNDTVVMVNGMLPDATSKVHISGDSINLALKNFSGTAYVKYQKGLKTMGQMKTNSEVLSKNESGEYVKSGLSEGWHTFYIQTDKRDYFTIGVYAAN